MEAGFQALILLVVVMFVLFMLAVSMFCSKEDRPTVKKGGRSKRELLAERDAMIESLLQERAKLRQEEDRLNCEILDLQHQLARSACLPQDEQPIVVYQAIGKAQAESHE